MFGSKSRRIKELEELVRLSGDVIDKKNAEINKLLDARNTAYSMLEYRYNLLESLLKQVRINVTLPARRG